MGRELIMQDPYAVATVFNWLADSNIYTSQSKRGGFIPETKLPMHKLELKVQEGLCTRGTQLHQP